MERNHECDNESETNESGSEANDESGPGTDSDSGSESEQKLNKYIRNTLEHEIAMDTVWQVLKMYVIGICVLYIYIIVFGK